MKAEIKVVKPQIWNFVVVGGKHAWKEVVYGARMSNVPDIVKDKKVFLMMVKNDYGSVLEHIGIKFDIKMAKGNAPELLEHRIASHTGKSTRYEDVSKGVERKNLAYEIIMPWEYLKLSKNDPKVVLFWEAITSSIKSYEEQLGIEAKRESARYSLLFAQAAGMYHFTMNLRSLLNLLSLRLCVRTSPEFRCIAAQLYFELLKYLPDISGLVGCRGFRPRSCSENEVTGVRKGKQLPGYPPCLFKNPKTDIYIPTVDELDEGGIFLKFDRQKATKAQEKVFIKWAVWEG